MDYTQQLKTWIEENPDFEIVAPVPLNLVCFKHKDGNEFNQKLHEEINRSGKLYITRTKINDEYILRFSIGQPTMTIEHVKNSWNLIVSTAKELS